MKWLLSLLCLCVCLAGCGPKSDPGGVPTISDETEYQAALQKARTLSFPYLKAFAAGDNLDPRATEDLTEARKQFDALVGYQPTSFAAHVGSGKISYVLGDLERAKTSLSQALALFPKNQDVDVRVTYAGVNDDLANVYFLMADFDKAQKHSDIALSIQPDNPNFLATKASLLLQNKKVADARAAVIEGLNVDPDNLRLQRLKRLIDAQAPPVKGN